MNKKIFFILSIALFLITFCRIYANPDTSLLLPASHQIYNPGYSVEFKWSTDYVPSRNHGMTLNLIYQNFKRYRIAYITSKTSNGIYDVKWPIPADFLAIRKINALSADFKIEIRPGDSLRNRIISAALITIGKTVPSILSGPSNPPASGGASVQLSPQSQLAAHYELTGNLEPWVIKKLTVVNDSDNNGFDPNPSESTDAISQVFLKYSNESGTTEIKSAPFLNYKATLSGLDLFIPKHGSAQLDIYAEPVNSATNGAQVSGKSYKLGIQDSLNDTSTFEAVGQITDTVINTPGVFQPTISKNNETVVRKNILNFDVPNGQQVLLDGDDDLFSFSITSNSASLGRIVFDVNQSGLTKLDYVRLSRNGIPLDAGNATSPDRAYLMWDNGASSCFADTYQSGGFGSGMDCNGNVLSSAKLILTFTREEIISGTVNYKLTFDVGGVDTGDNVSVRIDSGDDSSKPVFTGTDSVNAKIYNSGSDPELFSNAADFISKSVTGRNIIWSDRSADLHQYVTITSGNPPTAGTDSSNDWTNGYLLYLNALPSVTSVR